jgi:hypothetical protein
MRIVMAQQVKEVRGDACVRFDDIHLQSLMWARVEGFGTNFGGTGSRWRRGGAREVCAFVSSAMGKRTGCIFDQDPLEAVRKGSHCFRQVRRGDAAEAVVGCRRRRAKTLETLRELHARCEVAYTYFPPVRG